ncbi:FecCD family ABC transporter permease [Gordonia sp. MP11Mi]|uniref:Ferric enterobactin transport system permease protein FepG n=1 Tax=Gordonia sp. MP11Mi TaxID=3022769 RepID=A0AA97GV85_9ACTN
MNTTERVDFGRPTARLRVGPVAWRYDVRAVSVCGVILACAAVISLFALAVGDLELSLGDVVRSLAGRDDGIADIVVNQWRGPRVVATLVFGAALGVSGAIFQSLTRNPLASPDIIGFSAGSYSGALIVIVVFGGSYLQTAGGALIGGIATATVVYLLAYRGGVQGFRLIIVGIAVSAMLGSLNTWFLLTADLDVAVSAAVWGAGSLSSVGWDQVAVGTIAVVVLVGCAAILARPMRHLEMGDDAARALGVRAEPARLALVAVGVALTATVTAAAGPIAFVALAAPQIARRLTRTAGVGVAGAACMGALLLAAADFIAQHLLPRALPVGLVTVVIGGTYLIWLLIREVRRRA